MSIESDLDTIRRALGDFAILADGGPCMSHRNMHTEATANRDSVGAAAVGQEGSTPMTILGTTDALLKDLKLRSQDDINSMLLSLIFDLWRRNEYMYLALEGFTSFADESRAARIMAHHSLLEPIDAAPPINWAARAKACSVILHRLLAIVEPSHGPALDAAVTSASARGIADAEARATRADIGAMP